MALEQSPTVDKRNQKNRSTVLPGYGPKQFWSPYTRFSVFVI